MKRQFIHSLCCLCLGLFMVGLFSAPVFAYRVDPGCPDSEKMMANSTHAGWSNPMCFLEVAAYVKSLGKAGPNKCQEHGAALQKMFENNREKIRDLRRANDPAWDTWFTVRSELLQTCRMEDPNYAYVWNSKQRDYVKVPRTRDEVIQKKVEHQTAMAKIMDVLPGWPRPKAWNDTAQANKRVENLQGLLDLMIQKVQAGADLTPFIELIVNEGSPKKNNPHYVSDDVVNTAFLLYAYNVPANRADKVLKYTHNKYAPRVRFAAASAVAEFAKDKKTRNGLVANDPSGRLSLSDKQREQVLDIFGIVFDNAKTDLTREVVQYQLNRVYGDVNWLAKQDNSVAQRKNQAALGPITLVLTPSLAQMLAAEASAYASSIGASVASGTTALQAALAAPATALTGEVLIGAVPVVIFGMALDDAFAPTYRKAFEHKLREALHMKTEGIGTVSVGVGAEYDDEFYVAGAQVQTKTQTEAQTKTQTQRNVCVYLGVSSDMIPDMSRTDAGSGVLSNSALKNPKFILLGDAETYEHWNDRTSLGITRGECIRKNLSPECIAEREQLQRLYNKRNSFVGGSTSATGSAMSVRKLYARAVWRRWKWVLSVENADGHEIMEGSRPQSTNKSIGEVLENTFDEDLAFTLKDLLRWESTNFEEFSPRGWSVKIRNGVHDVNNPTANHFHLEQTCPFNPAGGEQICKFEKYTIPSAKGGEYYICNLAIYHKPVDRYEFPEIEKFWMEP